MNSYRRTKAKYHRGHPDHALIIVEWKDAATVKGPTSGQGEGQIDTGKAPFRLAHPDGKSSLLIVALSAREGSSKGNP
jgi:hypothetical protein